VIQSLAQYIGRTIEGVIVARQGVDADGVGADPTYDVRLFLDGHDAAVQGVKPTTGRNVWTSQGLDILAAPEGAEVWARIRKDGRMSLQVPDEGPAIFEQDCEE
jgi:hypothetical protein